MYLSIGNAQVFGPGDPRFLKLMAAPEISQIHLKSMAVLKNRSEKPARTRQLKSIAAPMDASWMLIWSKELDDAMTDVRNDFRSIGTTYRNHKNNSFYLLMLAC